ncbi:MAG: ABC transporter permease [Spirochaetaceae bacterium]|jgi:lipoprotein-releasing system permease protein|nr:ABC transporter permease [Spirochaetaceae bacterium]
MNKSKKFDFLNLKWIFFIAKRHIFKKRRHSSASYVLSIFGIATGVFSLTVIISVMNGFQMGFIESIIEISSYHVRVEGLRENNAELLSRLQEAPYVKTAVAFKDVKGIIKPALRERQSAVSVRGIEPGADLKDAGMTRRLNFESGSFDLKERGGVLLGSELARLLGVETGGECSLISVSGLFPREEGMSERVFTVRGVFNCGFYEYDLSWAFINIEDALEIEGGASNPASYTIGIKLNNRNKDRQAAAQISGIVKNYDADKNINVSSWRDYNKAFFTALRTEKLIMFVLVGLIFIITAMNIYYSQRRSVLERMEEIALLRAIGASPFSIRIVFGMNGFIVGLLGSTFGMIPALLISLNIQTFFSAVEAVINTVIGFFSYISGRFLNPENYHIFSSTIFYLKEIPARIIPYEVIFIYLFGFLSALLAALAASKRVSLVRPSETLRYE